MYEEVGWYDRVILAVFQLWTAPCMSGMLHVQKFGIVQNEHHVRLWFESVGSVHFINKVLVGRKKSATIQLSFTFFGHFLAGWVLYTSIAKCQVVRERSTVVIAQWRMKMQYRPIIRRYWRRWK